MQNFPKILRAVLKNCNNDSVIGPFPFEAGVQKCLKTISYLWPKKTKLQKETGCWMVSKTFSRIKKRKMMIWLWKVQDTLWIKQKKKTKFCWVQKALLQNAEKHFMMNHVFPLFALYKGIWKETEFRYLNFDWKGYFSAMFKYMCLLSLFPATTYILPSILDRESNCQILFQIASTLSFIITGSIY